MKIITNNIPRSFVSFYALPESVQIRVADNYENASEFEWISYKGEWYCLEDFMRISSDSPFKGWDRYASDTFFSGVLIKFVDYDSVIFGRYYS